MKIRFIFLVIICSAISWKSQPDNLIKISRINDRVVTFEYLDVNVTAVNSKKGILIIDTHRSPSTMKRIRGLIEEEFGRKDFLYVFNTHGDYDHCSGNQVFPHTTIIGQENCPGYMLQFPANTPQAISYFRQSISDMKKNLNRPDKDLQNQNKFPENIKVYTQMLESIEKEYRVTPPSETFKDSLILNLEDITIRMYYCGKAHTDNDILIYIPEEKIVFSGDIFNSKYSFGFSVNKTNDAQQIIYLMNQIIQNPSGLEYVIRGHGEYLSGNDFVTLRDLLMEKSLR